MLKVGLTGGIGSGKSFVCEVFKRLGVPVYHADYHAKILSDTDSEIIEKLSSLMGKDIYNKSGLDRPKLSSFIFSNPEILEKVNKIIHPKVREHFFKWCEEHHDSAYIIQEAAILFESGAYKFFDKFITVTAPENIRIQRVLKRPGMTRNKAGEIIKNQLSEEERMKRSHFILYNDEKMLVIPQVLKIHEELLKV